MLTPTRLPLSICPKGGVYISKYKTSATSLHLRTTDSNFGRLGFMHSCNPPGIDPSGGGRHMLSRSNFGYQRWVRDSRMLLPGHLQAIHGSHFRLPLRAQAPRLSSSRLPSRPLHPPDLPKASTPVSSPLDGPNLNIQGCNSMQS